MDEASITQYIMDTLDGIETATLPGATFFFYGTDRMLPFVTLVTNDDFDQASNLNRPSVFRLNMGISKQTFLSMFGAKQPRPGAGDAPDSGYDFTTLDQLIAAPCVRAYVLGLRAQPKRRHLPGVRAAVDSRGL